MMEATLPLDRRGRAPARFSFAMKILGAIVLVALADRLFYAPHRAGATLGIFALALLVTVGALKIDLFRRPSAAATAAAGAYFATLLIEDPTPLAIGLCWASLSFLVLLPRTARFGSGARWVLQLLGHAVSLPLGPIRDIFVVRAARRRLGSVAISARLPILILPAAGSIVFLLLFAEANPVIGEALGRFDPFDTVGGATFRRLALWAFILMIVWSFLRPRLLLTAKPSPPASSPLALPGVTAGSVTLSLLAFNAIFAVQNVLDAAFLWSGTRLPEGLSFAEYAHRGAYPLIATALLAGLFVLMTLRPGSDMAQSPLIRRLVSFWIAQNVFLVASTMLRTIRYVEAYSLTELRIEALIWMGLVAVGLVLICIRLWLGRSDTWLINANLAAAALVLSISAALDYDRIAAEWNVRHAREVGGGGAGLDLCYLHQMGSSALLPLIELEGRRLPLFLRLRVTWVRNDIMDRLEASQGHWSGWTWRGARRLSAAQRIIAERRLPRFPAPPRRCDGTPFPMVEVAAPPLPPVEVAPPPPLTAEPRR